MNEKIINKIAYFIPNKKLRNNIKKYFQYSKINNFIIDVLNIRLVEIEIFSFCNRKCLFCPNSFIDRHSTNNYMPENLYLKILQELKHINYSNMISYSRYNEPLSNKEIFISRIRQAKSYLPNATLHTNTNGDYLNRQYLDLLYDAGLTSMNIQYYLKNYEIFDIDEIKNGISNMAKKLMLKFEEVYSSIDRYEVKFLYKDMKLNMYARDFKINGTNRGGTLDTILPIKRTTKCYIPFTDIYIDYNGKVMPCCNFRSDIDKHQKFIIGDVNNDNILSIFNNCANKKLRYNLYNNIESIIPCNECNFVLDYKPDIIKKRY